MPCNKPPRDNSRWGGEQTEVTIFSARPDSEKILIFFKLDLSQKKQVLDRLLLPGLRSEDSAVQLIDPFGLFGRIDHRGYRARKEELIVAMRAKNLGSHSIEIVLKSCDFSGIWSQSKTFPALILRNSQTKAPSQPLFPPQPPCSLSDLFGKYHGDTPEKVKACSIKAMMNGEEYEACQ